MTKKWKRIRSQAKENLRLFDVRFDYLISPRTDKEVEVVVLAGGDAVNVAAVTAENKVVFAEQYRFGINKYTTEIPGGLIDPGETPLTAAVRELREETGYTAETWIYLGKIPQNPVFQDAYIHHYLAMNASLTDATTFDEAEDIALLLLSLDEVKKGLRNFTFQHPHSVSALYAAVDYLENNKI